ncbi:nucleoside deaminase [Dechloromonas sp. TW-R-39-2]|uniref:nucleoside deaminase n=1 Tax=Dechloromonas sp. TW-R-39-2 TaxID=2654218 RepID=UPI00193CC0A7|nr:nucleoside deaminase [Dechloromonas sp. TW-R-39-2]QRM19614.1 nucleoside deaminase [Dechloromonas sp. TW-R-39-2]
MDHDRLFLTRAVELAMRNVETCHGGPFGAVVVSNGKIIGEGSNLVVPSHDPTAHAEILAIRAACAATGHFHLPEATLYASSEPCPMCLSAAYWAKISRIVFANPRCDAAAIGFCDAELYAELNLPLAARQIRMEHHSLPNGNLPLLRWFQHPCRQPY